MKLPVACRAKLGLGAKAASPGARDQMMDGKLGRLSKAQFAFFIGGRAANGLSRGPGKTIWRFPAGGSSAGHFS